jgi:hypothetical protein
VSQNRFFSEAENQIEEPAGPFTFESSSKADTNQMVKAKKIKIMKTKLFVVALFTLVSSACLSQDVITYKNGKEAKGMITGVTDTDIKFKKEDNPEGPVYVVSKSEVFMIRYANGSKDVFGDKQGSTSVGVGEKKNQPFHDDRLKFSGPRIGFTILGDGLAADRIRELGKAPFITQFGWQFETRIFTLKDGTSGLFEFVPLVGGIEQGMFLPSVSGLFGIRGKKGTEFAFGPNLSLTGAGMVLAVGSSFHSENVYFPINLAVVPSVSKMEDQFDSFNGTYRQVPVHTGVRVSLLIGFMTRKK